MKPAFSKLDAEEHQFPGHPAEPGDARGIPTRPTRVWPKCKPPGSRVDSNVRVTFDRNVRVCPVTDACLAKPLGPEPALPFGDTVILEIKFSGRAPVWLKDLTQIGGLQRCSAAKYCDGILTRGAEHFSPECPPLVDVNRYAQAEAPAQLRDLRRERTKNNLGFHREQDDQTTEQPHHRPKAKPGLG